MAKSGAQAQKDYRTKRRIWLHEYKKKLQCVYCGEDNPLVIDLDHINPEEKLRVHRHSVSASGHSKVTPATMITGGYSWDKVLAEIAKCQPVCANCHRIKTILQDDKMKHVDISEYIPESMKDLRPDRIAPQVTVNSSTDSIPTS